MYEGCGRNDFLYYFYPFKKQLLCLILTKDFKNGD